MISSGEPPEPESNVQYFPGPPAMAEDVLLRPSTVGSVVVNRGAVSNGDDDNNQDFLLQPAEEAVITHAIAPEAVF